jgi:GH25 family lysozyme M1 (1,4-beta-N-acetylmuramidase)
MTYPKICDISFCQTQAIDWQRLHDLGIGIIARAGQADFMDNLFQRHYDGARAARVPFGMYWFFQPNLHHTTQLAALLAVYNGLAVKPKTIFIDVENIAYTDAAGTHINILPPSVEVHSVWLMKMLAGIEQATGVVPGVYTRADYWNTWVWRSKTVVNMGGTNYTMPDWSHYWLWIASWLNYAADIRLPADWKEWKVWQYEGGSGRQEGITGPVDMDYFNGTQAEMETFFGGAAPPPPPPLPTPVPPTPVPDPVYTLESVHAEIVAISARMDKIESLPWYKQFITVIK